MIDKPHFPENTACMSHIAAIDIGSNAIRLAIAQQSSQGLYIPYRSREPVRLGSSVFAQGIIDESTFHDLERALNQFKNQLDNYNVSQYRAIATSAMREARNGQDVVEKLFQSTGLRVEIISGQEEAQLVSNAISQIVDLKTGYHLLIDIGGGSIELIAMSDGKILKKQSFVLGMVRVLELQKQKTTPIKDWFPEFIRQETHVFFEGLPPLETAVGTGGNMDRFIKLKPFVSETEGIDLSREHMKDLYQLLSEVDYRERIQKFSLKPDRADVIVPAAIATLQFMKLGSCKQILFPQVGVKDGVLQELSSGSEN